MLPDVLIFTSFDYIFSGFVLKIANFLTYQKPVVSSITRVLSLDTSATPLPSALPSVTGTHLNNFKSGLPRFVTSNIAAVLSCPIHGVAGNFRRCTGAHSRLSTQQRCGVSCTAPVNMANLKSRHVGIISPMVPSLKQALSGTNTPRMAGWVTVNQ